MYKLLPCRQCGSPPDPINWTGSTEWFGMNEQTAYISCSGTKRSYCPVDISISLDTSSDYDHKNQEKALYSAWNLLNDISED